MKFSRPIVTEKFCYKLLNGPKKGKGNVTRPEGLEKK